MKIYYEKNTILWIAPGSFSFELEHLNWIMPYLMDLRKGEYPVEPLSDNKEADRRKGHTAPFEGACQIAAEIDRRLRRTGLDRYLVEEFYCECWDPGIYALGDIYKAIGEKIGLEPNVVRSRINTAMNYIASGECPRWIHCGECGQFIGCKKDKKVKKKPVYTYTEWKRSRGRIKVRGGDEELKRSVE